MRITNIAVTRAITVNLGNYNSFKAEVSLTAEIDPDEDDAEMFALLNEQAQEHLRLMTADVKGIKFEKPSA